MKNRIAAIMLVLMTASLGASVYAETDDRAKRDRGDRHGWSGEGFGAPGAFSEKVADRLGLDETQRQTLENIKLAAEPEMTALRERKKANSEKMKALDPNDPNRSALLNDIAVENGQLATEATLLFDRVRGEISAVLTDEQRAKVAEHVGRKGKGRKGRRGGK
ncbi:MAG: Spy/CpxP family protein refolding chaperone [Woeseiaceae bacterium]